MNKYMGFYELRRIALPTVSWKLFNTSTELDANNLWTLRVAVESGNDLHLPRAVGVSAEEAQKKGREFLEVFKDRGIVVYYPYFIADISGVLDVKAESTVIEAVEKDLWNLVTYGRKNVTIIAGDQIEVIGDEKFLMPKEISELLGYAAVIRRSLRDEINQGKSVFAEWSYGFEADADGQAKGLKNLLFYELRSI